jgi:hypothetical protein
MTVDDDAGDGFDGHPSRSAPAPTDCGKPQDISQLLPLGRAEAKPDRTGVAQRAV